jgi:hypothetical protein
MVHHKKSELQSKKEHYLLLYKSWKTVYCPYFKREVEFTLYGWKHLFDDKFRTEKELIRRLEILPLAKKLLSNTTTIQSIRFQNGAKHYEFQAVMDGPKIRVVIVENYDRLIFKSAFIV